MNRRTRRSGRRTEARSTNSELDQLPFTQIKNPFPPFEILSADEIESIHRASLKILSDIGIEFLLPEAREILKAAGADVKKDDPLVRFDPEFIENAISTAPSEFTVHARNPAHNLRVGGNHICISSVSSPPNATDIDVGRRTGNYKDYCDFLKLVQSVNVAHMTMGHPVEPIDLDPATRHLDSTMAKIEMTDKIYGGYSLGRARILDAIEMTRIARGITEEELKEQPSIFSNINANSPLKYDMPMLWGIIEMAQRNQPLSITPFTLAGAMAPVTIAGALTQQNAEALAGLSFVQSVNPGAPMIYGGFTSNVDMKTGSPAFGTPEYAKAVLIGGQLARRYNVPYRSSNVNASNAPDVQAAYESQMAIWSTFLAHANIIYHGLGWLEGGLAASFEKFIIDADMMQMMVEMMRPVSVEPQELALEAVDDVGPGGHFFGTQHTLERYETAFYKPILSDWRNYETWEEDGSVDATTRANRTYKQILEAYEPPSLDPAIKEELQAFVAKRKEEGGAPEA